MVDQTPVCCPVCTSPRVFPIGKATNHHQQRLRCKACGHRFTVSTAVLGSIADNLEDVAPLDTDAVVLTGMPEPLNHDVLDQSQDPITDQTSEPINELTNEPINDQVADNHEFELQERGNEDGIDPYTEAIQSSFHVLQSLLTQYPTMRQMVQTQPQLPAQNIMALFTALDNLIDHWQLEPIGTVWAKVAYDPQLHQGDQGDLELGEPVYVRFMGYRRGDQILVPARVSRQLPSGSLLG